MNQLDKLAKPFLALAPMDDVTDTVFRQVIAGVAKPDLMFTEFVNVDGLQSPGREKLIPKLWLSKTEGPVVAQIWGLKPENYFKTTKELKGLGFAGVDINMGCPVKTVIKNGACAALINKRPLAGEIIKAVQEAAGKDFPVSIKTRVGFTTVDLSWIEFLLSHKLNMLTIHGRTAKELSKIPANWGLIGKARQMRDLLCPATLIVGNGDVLSRRQAEELAKAYKLDGVMIGRGIFQDPLLFANPLASGSPWEQWDKNQKLELFIKHIELHQKTYGKGERKFEPLRKFCKVYINGFDGASDVRGQFMATTGPGEALKLLAAQL